MEIIGNRKYFDIPGGSTHELPPLLLKENANPASVEEMIHLAEEIVSSESLIDAGSCIRTITPTQPQDSFHQLSREYTCKGPRELHDVLSGPDAR